MKSLLVIFAFVALLQFATADGVSDPKKCEDFLPQQTCDNLRNVAKILHEKATTVRDAVQAAVAHHKTKASEMLIFIKGYIAQNFQCEKVLGADMCSKVFDIGQKVKLTAQQVRLAIEDAVAKGAAKSQDIYNKALEFMATEMTCAKVLGQDACDKMVAGMKKLKENTKILNEAIIAAVQKHYNNAKDLLQSVKQTVAEKVANFNCADVLTQRQCDFLTKLATKFHIKATTLRETLIEAVLSGYQNAKQVYDTVVGSLVEKAQNLKCEDLIPAETCETLDAFAKNIHLKVSDVTAAVKVAIANGMDSVTDTIRYVREYLTEKISCDTFLGQSACEKLETIANKLHVNYKKVIEKLRSLYASGVTKTSEIYKQVVSYIWNLFWGDSLVKRDADGSLKDKFIQTIMALVEKTIQVSKNATIHMKAEIKKLIEEGKVKIGQIRQIVRDLIAKYGPQSDDVTSMDEINKSLIEQLKEALKNAHGKAKIVIEDLLTKTKEQFEKIKEYIKQILNNQGQSDEGLDATHDLVSEMAYKEIDDEMKSAEEQINDMVHEQLF